MKSVVRRDGHVQALLRLLRRQPIVGIVGARQVGKTTLAHQVAERFGRQVVRFDLEDPVALARLAEPMTVLRDLTGLVILDEVQRVPDLFPILRVLADRPRTPARFLVLGSASPELLRQGSESLAGRIAWHELPGLSLEEVGADRSERLWLRGGFPRSFVSPSDEDSVAWRDDFVRTFLERDMPQLGVRVPATTIRRFWMMLAHYHGQVWNGSELGRALGTGESTVRRYLDLLTSALVVRQVQPWFENIGKRQVKAPKAYIADTGILHALLGIQALNDLEVHPKVGASWEGFALDAVIVRLGVARETCFFWATHSGAEIDLVVIKGRRRLGFEMKWTRAPRTTRSMHSALEALRLDRIDVIHAGDEAHPLAERIRAVPLKRIGELLERLG